LFINGVRRATQRTTPDGAYGHYSFGFRAPDHETILRLKVRAPAFHGLRAAATDVELIPVVIKTLPCRSLPLGVTIWRSGTERKVRCTVHVPVGATLRIDPGAKALFAAGVGIDVAGALVVSGTATRPVDLMPATSARWAGIAGKGNSSVDISHANVLGAQVGVDTESSAVPPTGHTRVSDSRFRNGGSGLVVSSNVPTVDTVNVSVSNSDFGGLVRGVWIANATNPRVSGNSFHGLSGYPVALVGSVLDLNAIYDNTGYGNAVNVWTSQGNVVGSDGVLSTGVAGRRPASAASPRPLMPLLQNGGLVVDFGNTVIIGPGVVKAMGPAVDVHGALDLEGTADAPVVITSAKDGSVGDGTGSAGTPAVADWQGIVGDNPSAITLSHAKIAYADTALSARSYGYDMGPLNVRDSVFAQDRTGIESYGPQVLVQRSTFNDETYGVIVQSAATPTISDNSFLHLSGAPIALSILALDFSRIARNTATDTARPYVSLEGLTAITADASWPMGSAGWNETGAVPAGKAVPLTVDVLGTVTIAAGVTVTFGPGAVKFSQGASLDVKGVVDVAGTDSEPSVFTSERDNKVGYPAGGPYQSGFWEGFVLEPGSGASVSDAVFRDAVDALTVNDGATAQLSSVVFAMDREAVHAYGTSDCGEPFGTASVTGSNVWFGASDGAGGPGGLSALASVTDELNASPSTDEVTQHDLARSAYDDAKARYWSFDPTVLYNTIPVADWACYQFSFPVSPVHVDVAATAPFADYTEAIS
jgi:hypothetical protein